MGLLRAGEGKRGLFKTAGEDMAGCGRGFSTIRVGGRCQCFGSAGWVFKC